MSNFPFDVFGQWVNGGFDVERQEVRDINRLLKKEGLSVKQKEQMVLRSGTFRPEMFAGMKVVPSITFDSWNFENADLEGLHFFQCRFVKCQMAFARFRRCTLETVELFKCEMPGAKIQLTEESANFYLVGTSTVGVEVNGKFIEEGNKLKYKFAR